MVNREVLQSWARDRRDAWEDLHRSYFPDYEQRWRRVAELVRGACSSKAPRILDLGCGAGPLTCSIATASGAAMVVGVDVDPLLVGIARAATSSPRTIFRVLRIGDGAWDELHALGPFDAVVSSAFVHCLDAATLVTMHRDARALLAPGGVLVTAEMFASSEEGPPPSPDPRPGSAASPWDEWWHSTLADDVQCAGVRAEGDPVSTATSENPPPLTLDAYRRVLEHTGYDAFVWRDGEASAVVVARPRDTGAAAGLGVAGGPRRP